MQFRIEDSLVFLETNRFDKQNTRSYLFSSPVKVIVSYNLEDLEDSFLEIERYISRGFFAAGFISYEAGFSFEDTLKNLDVKSSLPLLWFGIYKKPKIFRHTKKLNLFKCRRSAYSIKNLKANISRKKYINNIREIKDFIKKGDTYQVNYTFKYKFDFDGSLPSFYEDLKAKQSVFYSSFIKIPGWSILSLSPELFFRKRGADIEVRPMKGTFGRGKNLEEDKANMKILKESLKDRSENVMIVDLLRNDLGRISDSGSVRTKKLFEVERYETLHQMISIVKSRIKKGTSLYELFKAIFPSGSVTGAPKISTMKIINSLEKENRSIYTGSVGFFGPNKEACFNVAIRTLLINNKTKKGEMGIGSGIVYDSDPYKEFEECKLKANFIIQKPKDFKLIETILWQKERGYFLLDLHLDRLLGSCEYFNFSCKREAVLEKLRRLQSRFRRDKDYKVRVLLNKDGGIDVSFKELLEAEKPAKVRFSNKRTSSNDIFLYHKTTNRTLYDEEHSKWRESGYFDVIFTNEKNQVTEGAISNIMIKKNRSFYTPPLSCGLLDGVYRKFLFRDKNFRIKEKVLYRKDIEEASQVYMINSVRGMVRTYL